MNRWQSEAARTVSRVMDEHHPTDPAVFRKLAFDAYPFVIREYTPYKVWCAEVTRQARILGEPAPKPPRDFWMGEAK